MNNKKEIIKLPPVTVQCVTAAAECNSMTVRDMRETWIKDRAADFHFTHSRLLTLEVITFQAGKAYSNLDLNNMKYNNRQPTVQKQYVNVCMYVLLPVPETDSLTLTLVASTKIGHFVCSKWSTWSVQSMYVFKQEQEMANKVFKLNVFQIGLLNKLLFLWWCVTVMVMCYCYGDVLLLRWCAIVRVMCYCYGNVLLLWWCATVMVMCYCYGDVLLLWWC